MQHPPTSKSFGTDDKNVGTINAKQQATSSKALTKNLQKPFNEPTISAPTDVLEVTKFFHMFMQVTGSGNVL